MLIAALIIFILISDVVLILILRKPAEMHISRELLISAKPEVIFPHINNSQKANAWMPWHAEDPHLKMEFSGPPEGVGSTSSWNSKGRMGTGNAVVTESISNKTVKTKLTYVKPMTMSQLAEVSLTAASNGTIVRWSVTGKNNFIGRAMCLFINMDKMVGGSFEKGLSNLKNIVEAK